MQQRDESVKEIEDLPQEIALDEVTELDDEDLEDVSGGSGTAGTTKNTNCSVC